MREATRILKATSHKIVEIFRWFWQERRQEAVLIAAFLFSIVLVWPQGDFPLNDDWTYGKSVLKLLRTGQFHVGNSASTLFTHIWWGTLFVKVFGFSFNVLRLSSWVSVIAAIVIGGTLLRKLNVSGPVIFIALLCMAVNPIYYCTAFTFMTDVNFCTLLLCCIYLAHSFLTTGSYKALVMFFILSLMLVLLRQFGIIVPAALIIAGLLNAQRRWLNTTLAIAGTAAIYVVFRYYEGWLALKAQGEAYPSSEKYDLLSSEFWQHIFLNLQIRYKYIIAQVCTWSGPFLVVFMVPLIRKLRWLALPVIFGWALVAGFVLNDAVFPMGNIFINLSLGAETFYQTLNPDVRPPVEHTYSPVLAEVLYWVKLVSICISFSVLTMLLLAASIKKVRAVSVSFTVFCCAVFLAYIFLLLVSDPFFDRYMLPLVLLLIVIAAGFKFDKPLFVLPAWLYLLPMIYISVAGTRDYFVLNRLRWEAYRHLRFEKNIPLARINGGNEVNCWHEGEDFIWWDHIFLENHNYLIQYRQEPGFKVYREFEFYRFLGFRRDRLYIFERVEKI